MNIETKNIVAVLKKQQQDFEWYPTTNEMIDVVKDHIEYNADSILDIGAGDGRVLEGFSQKCKDAKLFSIEKSLMLAGMQSSKIVPVGTEFYEQNLAALPAEYIFCNPPYSDYEAWAARIVSEAYAKEAFLVLPHRWHESRLIVEALERREATPEIIWFGDFYNAERASRAHVDIVRIRYKRNGNYHQNWLNDVIDPFDQWFDQNIDTFDKTEEDRGDDEPKSQKEHLTIKLRQSDVEEMVASYQTDYDVLERNYRQIFDLDATILLELGVNKTAIREGLKNKMRGLKIVYWGILFDRLDAITSRLTTKSRKSLLNKLVANNTIEFTSKNIRAIAIWAINNANEYIDTQLVDLYKNMATPEGATNYKSNQKTWVKHHWRYNADDHSHFSLDYRIVKSVYRAIYDGGCSSYCYPGGLHDDCHNIIADMIAVFANLGFRVQDLHSKSRDWERGKWQDFKDINGETVFQVKGFMNGNLHIRVMPAAMQALNIKAAQLLKWVGSIEEAVDEMGYADDIVKTYFNLDQHITRIPMLQSGPAEN